MYNSLITKDIIWLLTVKVIDGKIKHTLNYDYELYC